MYSDRQISINDGKNVEVKALMANASHVSSISEPLASAIGLLANGHVFVAGFGSPTFPVAAPKEAVNVEFEIVDTNGNSSTKIVKIALVIISGKPHDLVLAKDWVTSFFDDDCCGQSYSPVCSFLHNSITNDRVYLDWGVPDLGPGYKPNTHDMSHNIRPDNGSMAKLLEIAGRSVGEVEKLNASFSHVGLKIK